jgi:hypothetical protein
MENTEKKPRKARTNKKEQVKVENQISYGFWFTTAIKDQKVQWWQDKEILVFFKNRGLSEKETKSRYDEMLKLY